MKKSVIIRMQDDYETRPVAANLVQLANRFSSRIYLESDGSRVNAKSIMGMMSLALRYGHEIVIDAEGTDEVEAVDALEQFLVK